MTTPVPRQPVSRPLAVATAIFFGVFLLAGLLVYRDYGLSWDEVPTREFGVMNVRHLVPDARTLDSLRAAKGPAYERFGPLFEMALVRVEDLVSPADAREVFFLRHLLTFLTFFAGVVLFHVFCRRRFTPGLALLASACLATIPQLFAHGFYNTKDISFLTAFVAAMLALDVMLGRPGWRTVLVHGVATAVLLGTRVIGLLAMLLTAVAALARRPTVRTCIQLSAYGAIVVLLLPLVWPVLRIDPVGIARDAILGATSNPYNATDLFRGRLLPATDLPRDYVPTWILITTPMVLSALFVAGASRVAVAIVAAPQASLREEPRDAIVLAWFLLPVLGAVVLAPIMYDGWRHLYFVYPAFVYLAAVGMEWVSGWTRSRLPTLRPAAVSAGLTGLLFIGLAPALRFLVAAHPYQHLYFNRLAGRDMAEVKQRFELDYWGLSYRRALEQLVRLDPSAEIRVRAANYPGVANSLLLPAEDRRRLRFVNSEAEADYFVTNYRYHPEAYPYRDEVVSVRVGNAAIASVFRLTPAR